MRRNQLIQLIHIALNKTKVCSKCQRLFFEEKCPECDSVFFTDFTEDSYRNLLKTLTGKTSSKDLSEDELEKVYSVFKEAGFKPESNKPQILKEIDNGNKGTIKIIYGRGKQVLGPSYESRIEGFVKMKFNNKSIYNLTKKELRTVIGWINRMSKTNN